MKYTLEQTVTVTMSPQEARLLVERYSAAHGNNSLDGVTATLIDQLEAAVVAAAR